MKILIAADSFKEYLFSIGVCLAIKKGIDKEQEAIIIPMSDGVIEIMSHEIG